MELGLGGKIAVVTGGSEGIGKAIALELLREGCAVAVIARRQAVLDACMQEWAALGFGERTLAVAADVTDTAAMEALCQAVTKRFGRLDIWINNAGRSFRTDLMELSDADWDACLALNLTAAFKCCRLAVREMRKTGGGVIVNALSFSTRIPIAGNGPYAVAKQGLKALTEVLAAEVAPDNIRVLGFTPGFIETPLTAGRVAANRAYYAEQCPAKRVGTPEDIAPAVAFLCSDLAGYVTGTDLVISGGKFCVQNPMHAWQG